MGESLGIAPGTVVLVTGASGFTGSVLVRKLCERGVRVNAIARASSNIEKLAGLPINWFRGEVDDPAVIESAMKGATYVFHVAAAYREAKIRDEDYHRVHVKSTQLLAAAALRAPGFARFVHVSTIGVHGHIADPPADESAPYGPGDIYQETKLEGELWIRKFAQENGLPLTVVRPAGIFGPGDRRLLKVFRMATKPVLPVLGFGKCLYHLIHVEDLAEFMIVAATHPAALGEVFICGNEESTSLMEMAGVAAAVYGQRIRVLRLPVTPFLLLGDLCELICRPLGFEPPIYRRRVAFYTKDRSFDTRKMREKLGFRPRSTREGLEQTARWYLEHGWVKV